MWLVGNESVKYRLGVLNEIKHRNVEDIKIVSVDGLTRFGDTIDVVFHQVRYTTKFVNSKDFKLFVKDLKEVYQAATDELALETSTHLKRNGTRSIILP